MIAAANMPQRQAYQRRVASQTSSRREALNATQARVAARSAEQPARPHAFVPRACMHSMRVLIRCAVTHVHARGTRVVDSLRGFHVQRLVRWLLYKGLYAESCQLPRAAGTRARSRWRTETEADWLSRTLSSSAQRSVHACVEIYRRTELALETGAEPRDQPHTPR